MPASFRLAAPFTLAALAALSVGVAPRAQSRQTTTIEVTEASGIRRTEYPLHAEVSVGQGALADATHVQLRAEAAPAPAQFTSLATWPDGSVRTLAVDFNATLAPGESRTYQLDYGPDVAAGPAPRGLSVTETADAVQVGNVTFSRSGSPLIRSAAYVRSEFVGQFPEARNTFAITDRSGARHDLSNARGLKLDVLERGPLLVVLQYSGQLPVDTSYSVPFTLRIDMPNSKSWVKMSASVSDPAGRVRDLQIDTPLALGAFPLTWDFGTPNGTYGAFRSATDGAQLIQTGRNTLATARGWLVHTGTMPGLRPYENSGSTPSLDPIGHVAFGWGHLQGAATAVAFGIDNFERGDGTFAIALDGRGQAAYSFSPEAGATSHRFTVYQHFVSTPVPIGAATTPTSMLHPPTVTVVAPR